MPKPSTILDYLLILSPRVVLIMAQPSHGSSSSPKPGTSSSRSSMSIINDDGMVGGLQYRRKEVMDGDRVRISEMARRRRHRGIPSRRPFVQDTSLPPYRSNTVKISENRPPVARQCAIIHQSKSSPGKELSSRVRNDSFVDISPAVNENWDHASREPSEVFSEYGELSPPPTPRLQRLSTPDLEPLSKVDPFCDCLGCYTVSLHPNEHQSQVSKRYCTSS